MPRAKVSQEDLARASLHNIQSGYQHHTYGDELRKYRLLQAGDPRAVEEAAKIVSQTGKMSADPLRNARYLFCCGCTLATRFAIEGGMDSEQAYTASDLYIQKMDHARSVDEVMALRLDMFRYFTNRMANIKKERVCSKPVVQCQDFIRHHLMERISLNKLAEFVNLNPSYLSTLFKRETGLSVTDYITAQRIEAAKNLLSYSELSPTEIAQSLGFNTGSYFSKVFRTQTGMTPTQYRRTHYHFANFGEDQGVGDVAPNC